MTTYKNLNQLWRRPYGVGGGSCCPCGVALGTVVVSKLFPNRYRSEATILVEPHKVPERYVVPNTTLYQGRIASHDPDRPIAHPVAAGDRGVRPSPRLPNCHRTEPARHDPATLARLESLSKTGTNRSFLQWLVTDAHGHPGKESDVTVRVRDLDLEGVRTIQILSCVQ